MASLILPLLFGMFGAGGTVLGVSWVARIIPWALLYHALIFFAFWVLYMSIGFRKNFNIPQVADPKDKKYKGDGPLDVLYYTTVVHTTTGFGDVYPITWQARVLVIIHIMLVFMHIGNLLPVTIPHGWKTMASGMGM